MILGCIDIGSNTTRLLVAEADGPGLRELTTERVFTCIRKSLDEDGRIPPEKIEETARVVREQVDTARELGAEEIFVVATAAVRGAPNSADLEHEVHHVAGLRLRVISGEEEARLSFSGATATLSEAGPGTIAVVDVGGGSTEIAAGTAGEGVNWWSSLPVGSAQLAGRHLRSDPPATDEIDAARREAADTFEGLEAPPVETAVAVGGTATSLLCVVGSGLDEEALEDGIRLLCGAPIDDLAQRLGLDRERVRLLPAGILVLQAASQRLGPLQVAKGGLREGVILEHAAAGRD